VASNADDCVDLNEEDKEESETLDIEDILMDEKKVTEAQRKINREQIIEQMGLAAEALEEAHTDFDELD